MNTLRTPRPMPHTLLLSLCTLLLLHACGERPEGTGAAQGLVADSGAVVPATEGWQVVHLDDGGRMEGELRDGIRHGTWTSYHANGIIRSRRTYEHGVEMGGTEVYHENGMTYYSGQYHAGNPVGTWNFFDPMGELIRVVEHDSLGNILEQR